MAAMMAVDSVPVKVAYLVVKLVEWNAGLTVALMVACLGMMSVV